MYAVLLTWSVSAFTEPTAAEIKALAGPPTEARVAVCEKYHNKLVKLTGTLEDDEHGGYRLRVYSKPKHLVLPLSPDETTRAHFDRLTGYGRAPRKTAPVTLLGWVVSRRMVERPSDDYTPPAHLRPKPTPAIYETLDQRQERIQREVIEDEQRQAQVIEDARQKGKLVTVPVYDILRLADVTDDLAKYPPT